MKILMVCAEFAPWAKTGGLADAVAGLSDALCASGHDVRVLLPRYSHLAAPRETRHTVGRPRRAVPARRDRARSSKPSPRDAGADARASSCSISASSPATPSIRATSATSAGSCTSARAAVALSAKAWRPDIVHCHDWHTALTPVLQRLEPRSRAPTVLTLHNVGYQGVFADAAISEQGFG